MPNFSTPNGVSPIGSTGVPMAAGPAGLHEVKDGSPFYSVPHNANLRDLQEARSRSTLTGVMEGGACTADGLTVVIPAGTTYYARAVWCANADARVSVPNESTTYLWGCSEGQIRQTSVSTPPVGFTARTACLLTVATAKDSVVTLDNSAQHRANYADHDNRVTYDGPLVIDHKAGRVHGAGLMSGGISRIDLTGQAAIALTAMQLRARVIVFEGTLLAPCDVTIPANEADRIYVNSTSGPDCALTVKTATGTGIAVPADHSVVLFSVANVSQIGAASPYAG